MRNREITPEGKLTLIAIEVILLIPIAYMFHYLKTTEAKLKEMALKKRGVDTMCSYLSEEPIVQLEYTH